MLLQGSLPESQCPPLSCLPPPSHPTPKVEAWSGCQEAGGAASWGAGSRGARAGMRPGVQASWTACMPAFH